jgi:hypothetical protein
MERPVNPTRGEDVPDPERRLVLAGIAAVGAASFVPALHAQPAVTASPEAAFDAVSRVLTGRDTLDGQLASRLFHALAEGSAQFAADVQAFAAWIGQRQVAADQLQGALDAESSPLAALPRTIATAWFTGIVGENERARSIAFETALMHVAVADRLRPPSYCYGPPGSWTAEPGTGGAHG